MTNRTLSLSGSLGGIGDIKAFEARPITDYMPQKTIYDAFCNSVKKFGDKTALITLPPGDSLAEGTSISFKQLLGRVNQTANLFRSAGLEKGESVAYILPICPQAIFTMLGAKAVGTVNAINPLLEPEHILGIAKAANATILVVTGKAVNEELWEKAAYLIERMPNLKAVYVLGGGEACDGEKIHPLDEMIASKDASHIIGGANSGLDDVVGYYHTGGTTGVPKLATHTNAMQLSQVVSIGYCLGLTERDNILMGLPLFHISGSIVLGIVPLIAGATLVLVSPLGFRDPLVIGNFWKLVEKYKVTILGAVPTMLSALLNVPVGDSDISTLRIGLTGSAAAPLDVLKGIREKSGVTMLEGYGMTESTSFITMQPRDGETRFGSVGIRSPYVNIKSVILNDNGTIERDAAVDEIGIIVMKGPSIMPGYVQEASNVTAFVGDKWLNSGDLGRVDKDGYIWITGRAKDVIIRSGHNIDPSIIEEVLYDYPAVELAAAVGRPDSYAGEIPVAYVQLKPGCTASPEELRDFVRGRIPERAANPSEITVLEKMPLTAAGKIFKPDLRKDAAEKVFNTELDNFRQEADKMLISIDSHKIHGLMATITVQGGDKKILDEKIRARFGAYTMRYQIVWEPRP